MNTYLGFVRELNPSKFNLRKEALAVLKNEKEKRGAMRFIIWLSNF